MHILHLYKDYYPVLGGIENHVRALAEAQVRRGHTVTVLVTNRGAGTLEETRNGVHVIKAARLATLASTPLSIVLPLKLRALRPDIIHLHAPYPFGEAAWHFFGPRVPSVITYHAEATRWTQRLIMRAYAPLFQRVLERAARLIATSAQYARSSPYLQAWLSKVTIIPLGSDPERFTPAPPTNERPFTILFAGMLRHYKGVDDLLRALKLLTVDARLIVAGEGPMRAAWEALARDYRLGDRVTFAGRVLEDALPALYHSADVFILPALNRAEAFGTVLVEAMLSGLPCLTTEVGSGTSFVVQPGVTGLVVPPRSPVALADALTYLHQHPALRTQMGRAGRERALRDFTEARMIERVEAVYNEVSGLQ
jgi:rhamnosyl/mannosyltransferase